MYVHRAIPAKIDQVWLRRHFLFRCNIGLDPVPNRKVFPPRQEPPKLLVSLLKLAKRNVKHRGGIIRSQCRQARSARAVTSSSTPPPPGTTASVFDPKLTYIAAAPFIKERAEAPLLRITAEALAYLLQTSF